MPLFMLAITDLINGLAKREYIVTDYLILHILFIDFYL